MGQMVTDDGTDGDSRWSKPIKEVNLIKLFSHFVSCSLRAVFSAVRDGPEVPPDSTDIVQLQPVLHPSLVAVFPLPVPLPQFPLHTIHFTLCL